MERRIQATHAMVGTTVGCVLRGVFLFHLEIVTSVHTEIPQSNPAASANGGIVRLLQSEHIHAAVPERR
jgi:hypothetical protein